MDRQEDLLSIEEASLRLKIPKHTLRFWEKTFEGLLIPLRTQGGQRRYASGDMMMIEQIKKLRDQGMSLYEIKRELNHGDQSEHPNLSKIDLLANRVAEVVKSEVSHFLIKSNFFDMPKEIK